MRASCGQELTRESAAWRPNDPGAHHVGPEWLYAYPMPDLDRRPAYRADPAWKVKPDDPLAEDPADDDSPMLSRLVRRDTPRVTVRVLDRTARGLSIVLVLLPVVRALAPALTGFFIRERSSFDPVRPRRHPHLASGTRHFGRRQR